MLRLLGIFFTKKSTHMENHATTELSEYYIVVTFFEVLDAVYMRVLGDQG